LNSSHGAIHTEPPSGECTSQCVSAQPDRGHPCPLWTQNPPQGKTCFLLNRLSFFSAARNGYSKNFARRSSPHPANRFPLLTFRRCANIRTRKSSIAYNGASLFRNGAFCQCEM
jgi:hypothetical protein